MGCSGGQDWEYWEAQLGTDWEGWSVGLGSTGWGEGLGLAVLGRQDWWCWRITTGKLGVGPVQDWEHGAERVGRTGCTGWEGLGGLGTGRLGGL